MVFIILLRCRNANFWFQSFWRRGISKRFFTRFTRRFLDTVYCGDGCNFFIRFLSLDFIEIAVVVVPIIAPILLAEPGANISAIWLGSYDWGKLTNIIS